MNKYENWTQGRRLGYLQLITQRILLLIIMQKKKSVRKVRYLCPNLLKGFSGDVEREIFGVYDTLDEAEVFGDELLAVIHDEDAADVELDVVLLLLVLEKVEGGAFGDEQEGLLDANSRRRIRNGIGQAPRRHCTRKHQTNASLL